MRSRALLLGRIIIDPSDNEKQTPPKGLVGARVYMEDGRYALTDERGMFHFEDVTPGTHVIQLDLDTIPSQFEVVATEHNTRFAGSAISQFVDVQGGTLWRTDFHVKEKKVATGKVSLQIINERPDDSGKIYYRIRFSGDTVPVENLRLNVALPKGTSYLPGSAQLDGKEIDEPRITEDVLTFKLGELSGDWSKTLRLAISTPKITSDTELNLKAYLLFNNQAHKNLRSPVAEHSLPITSAQTEDLLEEYIIRPHFRHGGATLQDSDHAAIEKLVARLRVYNNKIRIHAVGHTDDIP